MSKTDDGAVADFGADPNGPRRQAPSVGGAAPAVVVVAHAFVGDAGEVADPTWNARKLLRTAAS